MKQQVEMFAKCTGNDNPSFDYLDKEYLKKKGDHLLDLMVEEVEELSDALRHQDITEMVDAIADIGVYYYQFVSLLERAGVDYQGVCDAVCENNASKYTTSAELAEQWLKEWQEQEWFGYYVSATEVDGQMYYSLKDLKTKKVKKWKGFPQVSLKEFIPEKYL